MNPNNTNNEVTEYLEKESCDEESKPDLRFVHQQVEAIMQDQFNLGQKSLREVDIVNEYLKYLLQTEGIEYEYRDKQPNVHKALAKLIKDGKVVKAVRRYYLVHPDNTKEVAKKKLIDNVRLQKRDIFTMSISAVILYPTPTTLDVAREWLLRYLGSSCYGIANCDGYLLIMLKGKKEELTALRKDIKELAAEIYDKHTR